MSSSCKKEEMKNNAVEYKITCDQCRVTISSQNSTIYQDVDDFFILADINNNPKTTVTVSGDDSIRTQVKLNGKKIFDRNEYNGSFTYSINLK